MNEAQVRTLEQVRQVLEGTHSLEFRRAEDDKGRYAWIEAVLRRLEYRQLKRSDRGVVLAYLQRLPLDQIKIDQSFVRDIGEDANDTIIVKTIVAMAQSLGLDIIAEGVETQAQKAFLAEIGCHAYQGYLFSAPVPLPEFERLVGDGTA